MKPLSIRTTLISWFVGFTTLLLVAFSITLYFTISRALRAGLDAQLETAATGLVALCDWDEDRRVVEFELSEELAAQLAASFPARSQEAWFWHGRRLLHRSGEPLDVPLPDVTFGEDVDLDGGTAVVFSTIEDSPSGPRRLITVLVRSPPVAADIFAGEPPKPAFTVLVRVAENLAPIEAQLAQLAWFVVVLASVSAVVVVGFGILLSRRIVRPLRELGEAAARIQAGDTVTLPQRGVGDEVEELRCHLEDAFLRLEDALRRQTRFTSDAAHELRNPIAVIQNAAEIALRRERPGDEYRLFLDDVHATSRRMGSVVEALLLLARIDAGTVGAAFKEVDLVAIAHDSAAVQPSANGRVNINGATSAIVDGDQALLRVLVDNLLSNALRYSGPESTIFVTVADEQDEGGGGGGGGAVLRVRDEGPGIPEKDVDRVFDRFYRVETANPDAPGAGLGLAIVAEVARVHAATSRIESSPQGTTISVRFPAPSLVRRD